MLGCRQVGKAPDFDSGIRWFESSQPSHLFGPLAQSVEHLTFNQGVPRSSRGWVTVKLICFLNVISKLQLRLSICPFHYGVP